MFQGFWMAEPVGFEPTFDVFKLKRNETKTPYFQGFRDFEYQVFGVSNRRFFKQIYFLIYFLNYLSPLCPQNVRNKK